jgi:hypothetical protein
MELWWKELNTWAQRDQLCLCYAAWKKDIKIGHISENPRFKNSYFKWYPHKKFEKRFFYRFIRKLMYLGRWIIIYPFFAYRIGFIGRAYLKKPS